MTPLGTFTIDEPQLQPQLSYAMLTFLQFYKKFLIQSYFFSPFFFYILVKCVCSCFFTPIIDSLLCWLIHASQKETIENITFTQHAPVNRRKYQIADETND